MVVDISNDGKKLMEVDGDNQIRIYDNSANTFSLTHTLNSTLTSNVIKAGVMTDDGTYVIFGTWDNYRIDVYKYSDIHGTYSSNQTIDFEIQVRNIALTPDHSFLVVGSYGIKVVVYKHSGTQFA